MKNIIKKLFKKLFKKEELYSGGLLGIGEKPTDFVFGSVRNMKQKLSKKNDLKRKLIYEYDQGAQYDTRNYCTIYSAITELSFLFNRKFSLCEIREIADRMIKDKKLDPDKGAYLADAIDYTRRWWNENNVGNEVESYQINYTDIGLLTVLDSHIPRPTQLGYRTSGDLYKDTLTGTVNGKDYKKLGGHAVTRFMGQIVNNYKRDGKLNRFRFTYLQDLIKNGVVFEKGYLFLKK